MIVVAAFDRGTALRVVAALNASAHELHRNGRTLPADLAALRRELSIAVTSWQPLANLAAPAALPQPDPDGLTYRQAAHMLGVSESTVMRRVKAGELASFRVGRSVRVPRSAVAELVQSNTHEGINR